jgi:HD-GYP domain-containing protein (c-di-GMP phosphodiesterase class II)
MRVVRLSEQLEGQILAIPIHGEGGRLLLAQGSRLTKQLIGVLLRRGYTRVAVDDHLTRDIELDQGISEETRRQAIEALHSTTQELLQGKAGDFSRIKSVVDNIIDDIRANENQSLGIYSLCSFDEDTFNHSVNVCMLSLVIATQMPLNSSELRSLGLGALLHDIGKLLIPKSILNKPASLTDREHCLVRTHVEKGWKLLSQCYSVSAVSAHCALDHHERIDGSGYPRKIKGDNISLFGKITAVADVFEAMNSDRPQRKAIFPEAIHKYLNDNKAILFDKDSVDILYSKVALYPTGSILSLWGGFVAVVVRQDPRSNMRPIVRLITGPGVTKPVDIALFDRPELTVNMVLDDYPNELRRIISHDS